MFERSGPTSQSSARQQAVNQPTRGSDQNQDLADRTTQSVDDFLLPSLDDGITLLEIKESRGVPVLQSLVLDHLLLNNGPAFWVDADGHATTTTLSRITPSQRLLNRIHVARGFTAYQHYSAVCDLPSAVNQSIRESSDTVGRGNHQPGAADDASPQKPALIVVPSVDVHYRTDDSLSETHAETLQARTLACLSRYADGYDIPVLVTRTQADAFTEPVTTAAHHHIECKQTQMGPRIIADDFETLVYPVDDGAFYQTTLAYWQQVLAARAVQVGVEPMTPSASLSSPDSVGTGVTASGDTTSMAASPLLDAWTAANTGGR